MLSPVEVAAIVAATKGAVDLFDKFGGQLMSFLRKGPKDPPGDEYRWKIKIGTEGNNIVVKREAHTVQTITHDQLASKLHPSDLELVKTYEKKMKEYFTLWVTVYDAKDSSADPLVNAKTDAQLQNLVLKMRSELLGILSFLEQTGVQLDDHYLNIRQLVQSAQ